jgi:hypothetical protein
MKDFIIGSDEFLVRELEQIEQHVSLTSRPKYPLPNRNEQELNEDDQSHMQVDKNRDFFNTTPGRTPLHSFNALIKSLHACHDEISKSRRDTNNKKIRNISIAIRISNMKLKSPEIHRKKLKSTTDWKTCKDLWQWKQRQEKKGHK